MNSFLIYQFWNYISPNRLNIIRCFLWQYLLVSFKEPEGYFINKFRFKMKLSKPKIKRRLQNIEGIIFNHHSHTLIFFKKQEHFSLVF